MSTVMTSFDDLRPRVYHDFTEGYATMETGEEIPAERLAPYQERGYEFYKLMNKE